MTPFPDGVYSAQAPDTRPVARIRLVRDATVQRDPLFAQVFRRHTHRGACETRMPEASALAALQASVAGLPVTLGWVTRQDQATLARHARLAMEAWRVELFTPRTLRES